MFPVSPDQLANEYNIVATEIPFWCMDKLSTCCCTHPVEWKVTAKFSEKRDADYFLQYMSKTVPAYLSIVHKVCTVNEYKGEAATDPSLLRGMPAIVCWSRMPSLCTHLLKPHTVTI